MVYAPTVLFSLGEGAVIPLIPVIATRLGADVSLAALVASALVIGQLCGNLPAGALVAKIGERFTMVVAGALSIAAGVVMLLADALALFAVSVFVLGFCAAAFGLARHAFMTTRVPPRFRARALSLLGGSFRFGVFIGPFVAAALIQLTGSEQSTIWALIVCCAAIVPLVLFGPDPEKSSPVLLKPTGAAVAEDSGEVVTGSIPTRDRYGVLATISYYRGVLMRLGTAAAALSAVRSARQVIVPLWGVSLGLDASTIAIVVGVSGAIDFALFYASGQVMDRFGRIWAALPAMLLMGVGLIALSLTHDLDQASMWYALMAAVLGLGNGLSSGILLTYGADLAPETDPATFLGAWRTLTDAGGAAAPVVIASIVALASLPLATGMMGGVALLGAAGFAVWTPRFLPRHDD
ncbi:MFS transporter [Microbacterium esteraromaticum]|uniref:MFS transporter n=1 Tax=Microbacterium esteraromaticum TaxID=57043 RepID=UPI00195CC398|nr:MFS transporter [Microbacterium esteraromaticum]MBM7464981.1 MFS family permease [Microbacterium esteraromaticum]